MEHEIVASQIHASLRMLRSAIESCPEALWNRASDRNRFWVLAYHTVFFAHLYLSPSEGAFKPFGRRATGHPAYGRTHLGDWTKLIPEDVFSKEDVLAYCKHVEDQVDALVQSTPFDAPSGFNWLGFSKGETHFYNLRHIQHHAGQLIDRLRQEADIGTPWVRDGR